MLTYLKIKNFITISECEIDFKNKLNVITGESGAGKSIIFNAIEHLFGKASNQSFIKANQSFFEIEGYFKFDNKTILSQLAEYQDDDNPEQFFIYRKVDSNKNITRINNKPVTLKLLKELTSSFAVVISQHHQLMLEKHHYLIQIIDSFFEQADYDLLDSYQQDYQHFLELNRDLKSFNENTNLDQSLDFLDFQINDISQHNFKIDEELELEALKNKIKHNSKHMANSKAILRELNEAKNSFNEIISRLSQLSDISTFSNYHQQLAPVNDILSELNHDLSLNLNEFSDLSARDIDQIEERLDIIFKQKIKYKVNTLNDLIALLADLKTKKHNLANYSKQQETYLKKINDIKESLIDKSKRLNFQRQSISMELSKKIIHEASQLNLGNISLNIDSRFNDNQFDKFGCSKISFLISLNPGAPLKDISKVASGGELSRILLSIYAVISTQAPQNIFLFDEIDTGVGGITANHIGQKLKQLSNHKQLFCITHLAQIAQHADQHILVKKLNNISKTESTFIPLDEKEKHSELHRMVGGETITEKLLIN